MFICFSEKIILASDSESDTDMNCNFDNMCNESEKLFTENADYIPRKKNKLLEVVAGKDNTFPATNCSLPRSDTYISEPDEYSQYAQRWSSPDYTVKESQKHIPNSEKQFCDAAVMTEPEYKAEENENIRISNLMFCKFISHELDRYTGDERYNLMQEIIKVFKKNNPY